MTDKSGRYPHHDRQAGMSVHVDQLRTENTLQREMAESGFERRFHEHWERVFGILYRLVGDQAEAEDLASEVFWRLYRRPPRKEDEPHVSAWLYRVATNLGFNALRARSRRLQYEDRAARLPEVSASIPDPAREMERGEERAQVRRVLNEMNPRQARLLILRHSGLSYAELAAALKVSPGSIGTLLARAERQFERCYRELEGGD